MQKTKIFALIAMIVIVAGFFALNNRQLSGFFSLSEKNNPDENKIQENGNAKEADFGAELSFEVLKKSELSAKLFLQDKIPDCPETTDANIFVENKGNEKIEALKVKAVSELQIRACSNCIVESLGIGESQEIQLKLCNASEENPLIRVSSANTEQVEIKIA